MMKDSCGLCQQYRIYCVSTLCLPPQLIPMNVHYIAEGLHVCTYLYIFSFLLQLWDARFWRVLSRWYNWWGEGFGLCSERRESGCALPCGPGQDRYDKHTSIYCSCTQCVSACICNALMYDQCVCLCFAAQQVSWSPVTWSTPCASAQVRPSTTCGLNGLDLSKPGHRSARCLILLACLAHSWSNTQTSACGMEPLSPCSTT